MENHKIRGKLKVLQCFFLLETDFASASLKIGNNVNREMKILSNLPSKVELHVTVHDG